MSDFLAIATVTATLRRTLQNALSAAEASEPGAVSGAQVTSVRPNAGQSSVPERGINVFLYHVAPNPYWRNEDLPTMRSDGTRPNRPQAALDLQYLLSFYGQESQLEPDRLLGLAVRTLHAQPVMTRQAIKDTLADPLFNFLAPSNLAEQIDLVKLVLLDLSLEDLSKLWSVFFQVPYTLSIAYLATVVLIESPETVQPAPPVREPLVYVLPFRQPVIERVTPDSGAGGPILAGSTLIVEGRRLGGESSLVRISGADVAPLEASDTQVKVALPAFPAGVLQAGVLGLQVVQPAMLGDPPVEHGGVQSNVAAIVLRPQVQRDPQTGEYQITKSSMTGSGDGPYAGNITLEVAPAIGRTQQVLLLLNRAAGPGDEPAGYSFTARLRDPKTAPLADPSITIPIHGVAKGTYLLRVRVDGAESPLDFAGGQYTGPSVAIP